MTHQDENTLFVPPHPRALTAIAALIRTVRQGDGDLLSLLPNDAYRMAAGELGYSRRSIKLINDPALIRDVMIDPDEAFPKSDLMVGALEPLIGESIFVSDGEKWRRQRAMIDPAFSHMRLSHAFTAMNKAVDDYMLRLDKLAASGDVFSLDLAMSHLTADIICRTVFSTSLQSDIARDVFDDFLMFERDVAQVRIWRLITDRAWARVEQPTPVLAACARIRNHLGALIDTHLVPNSQYNDIAQSVIDARDIHSGAGFSRDELIDQLGVFFLAGHETTASALTWAFFILAQCGDVEALVRAEAEDKKSGGVGARPFYAFNDVKAFDFIRAVFKETLRLYPPITFMPRVAVRPTKIGHLRVRKGALIMIAPWTVHRHQTYWEHPNAFSPDRFLGGREDDIQPGAYIPFGLGPHTCVGAGFAAIESALIMARLTQRYRFNIINADQVMPAARLTTRPREQIMVSVQLHEEAPRD